MSSQIVRAAARVFAATKAVPSDFILNRPKPSDPRQVNSRTKSVQGGLLCGSQLGCEASQIYLAVEFLFSVGEAELKLGSPIREALSGRFSGKGHEGSWWVGTESHFAEGRLALE